MTKLFFFSNVNLIPYIYGHFFDSLQSLSEVFYIIQNCEVEFKIFPSHCLKGTKEAELIDELKEYEENN